MTVVSLSVSEITARLLVKADAAAKAHAESVERGDAKRILANYAAIAKHTRSLALEALAAEPLTVELVA